jgi:hypothetical protein
MCLEILLEIARDGRSLGNLVLVTVERLLYRYPNGYDT